MKLKIPALQGIGNKVDGLLNLAKENGWDVKRILYVGNDLNDYRAMQLCGYTICPGDSHYKVKELASVTLKSFGGNGVVREILEDVLEIDFLEILYPE